MLEAGTELIRIQTGQHYVIEKTELSKAKGKIFKKEVLYHLKHENGPIDLIVHEDELKSMFKFVKQTNADRIRSMSDEELDEFMQKAVFCGGLIAREESSAECRGCELPFCSRKYIEWLQSKVEEGACDRYER